MEPSTVAGATLVVAVFLGGIDQKPYERASHWPTLALCREERDHINTHTDDSTYGGAFRLAAWCEVDDVPLPVTLEPCTSVDWAMGNCVRKPAALEPVPAPAPP